MSNESNQRTGLSRRALLGAGASGAVILTTAALSVTTATPASASQSGWLWCNQCQSLWWPGNGFQVRCPKGPGWLHNSTGSGRYVVNDERSNDGGQSGWRWCAYCQALWFAGNGDRGYCTINGAGGHTSAGSRNYRVVQGLTTSDQDGWAWCRQCDGLWYFLNGTGGYCAFQGGGFSHSILGSGGYALNQN
ncbi:hypothetical protein J5X84_30945 [Streptosporangiaceae bacterium NEAU-GS5]|nr:hypothetical protein [Streptosporangiaceae bacterium NEAU-GS5]